MANEFLDKVEDNAIVRIWSEKVQLEKGDSLAKGYVSELWDYTHISVTQNSLQELKEIWDRWNDETKQLIKQKGECKCIPWRNLQDLILVHPDGKKKVDVFALSIYGLVIFPRVLGHVDEAISDLFDQLDKGVTPVPTILAETLRSLNACRRAGEGKFIGCAQLLLASFHSHFWKVDKISYRVFSEHYSLLKEIVAMPRRDDISEENWMAILQNLREEDVEWRAHWLIPDRILYRCESFDWVPLLGIWGAVGYAPLLVLRMKRLAVGSMTTPEYGEWRSKRINDNIPELNLEGARPMEEYLQVIPSELEIIKQDFERKNLELEKKIEWLEEEKMYLRLDADVQKSEVEKLRKGKNKAEEDLDSLKMDYKKLRLSMRTAGLGKTSEQWRQEIQEGRNKADRWERRSQETQVQKETLEWIEFLKGNGDRWKEQLYHSQSQIQNRDYIMGRAVAQIREVADHLQIMAIQADVLSVKYELESDQGQDLATLLKGDQLQMQMKEQLEKIQQDMTERMLESQKDMMTKLMQLLTSGVNKGKGPMVNDEGEDKDGPPGFTPPHVQTQAELYPRKYSVTIKPQ
ncbi:hypothetical protein Gotur_026584 [Gossypium turneri]